MAVWGGGKRAEHSSPASTQAPVVHPVSANSRTASVATNAAPAGPWTRRLRSPAKSALPHHRPPLPPPSTPPPQPRQPAPLTRPDRHHESAAYLSCARWVVVSASPAPPARARAAASSGLAGARSEEAGAATRRGSHRPGGCATPQRWARLAAPRQSLCERGPPQRARGAGGARSVERGGGQEVARKQGEEGVDGAVAARATAWAAAARRGGAAGRAFGAAVRAQPRVLRSSNGGAAAARRTLPNGGRTRAQSIRPFLKDGGAGGGASSVEPDGDGTAEFTNLFCGLCVADSGRLWRRGAHCHEPMGDRVSHEWCLVALERGCGRPGDPRVYTEYGQSVCSSARCAQGGRLRGLPRIETSSRGVWLERMTRRIRSVWATGICLPTHAVMAT